MLHDRLMEDFKERSHAKAKVSEVEGEEEENSLEFLLEKIG